MYSTLSNHDGEYPVDYEAFAANPTGFTVVACNAEDGSTKYFDKSDVSYDNFDIMKASSAVPLACEPYVIDGVPYYDGGIADPIPVQKALDDGYDRVVVILTPGGGGTPTEPMPDLQRRGGAGQRGRAGRTRADPRAGKPIRPEHLEQIL